MPEYGLEQRLNEVIALKDDYPLSFPMMGVIAVVLLLIGIGISQVDGFGNNFYSEVVSIIITVGVIDVINRHRENQKDQRIYRALNANFGKEIERTPGQKAFIEMAFRDLLSGYKTDTFDISGLWLSGSKIKKTFFKFYNMRDTQWQEIDFRNSVFYWVDLTQAVFKECHMNGVQFTGSRLRKTQFIEVCLKFANLMVDMEYGMIDGVNLRYSNLSKSSFRHAVFEETDLRGVNFTGANLVGCHFSADCKFDSKTILPDGSLFDTSDDRFVQLNRFTNPNNENFYPVDEFFKIDFIDQVPNMLIE